MNFPDEEKPQFVFTLTDDDPPTPPAEPTPAVNTNANISAAPATTTTAPQPAPKASEPEESLSNWEQRLEQLRREKKRQPANDLPIDDIFRPSPSLSQQDAAAKLAHTLDTINMRTGRPAFAHTSGQHRPSPATPQEPTTQSNSPAAPPVPNIPVAARPTPRPSATKSYRNKNEAVLDPIQREQVYRAYLQEWQHRTSLEEEQRHAALNDTAVLLQEDWLAAQNCLTKAADDDTPTACTVQLKRHHPAEVLPPDNENNIVETNSRPEQSLEQPTNQSAKLTPDEAINQPINETQMVEVETETKPTATIPQEPVIHVHLHVLEPQGTQGRAITCLSETELLRQLTEKLRPHLADAMSGMVRTAIQKQTAHLVSRIQQQLLEEIPETVDEILRHHLHRAMQQIKKSQYGRQYNDE